MAEINVGLIGYGMGGRIFHAPFIAVTPNLKLKKIVTRRNSEAVKDYPSAEIVRTADELFDDPEINLVVVATPNSTHFELTEKALRAGKNVVVEKPFTVDSAEARKLIELAKERNLLLSVHQNRRWDGDFLTIKKIIAAGLLGDLVEYEAHFDRFRNFSRGGWKENDEGTGVLYDLGSHLIDQALMLFGTPEAVYGDLRTQRDFSRVVDNFEVVLHYPKLKVTLKSGMLVRAKLPRFILHGTHGSFVKYGLDPQEEALNAGRKPSEANWGVESPDQWGTIETTVDDLNFTGSIETVPGSYQNYYGNISETLAGSEKLIVTAEQGFNVIRIIELAIKSSEEKRTVEFS